MLIINDCIVFTFAGGNMENITFRIQFSLAMVGVIYEQFSAKVIPTMEYPY